LKLENILFEQKNSSSVRVIDFQSSAILEENQMLKETYGSAYYIAPEVLLGEYDKRCDIWSIGVILYILLSGSPPFEGKT